MFSTGVNEIRSRLENLPGDFLRSELPQLELPHAPFLLASLAIHGESEIRLKATCALSLLGADATPVAGVLLRGLQDPDILVRSEAANALASIGPTVVPEVIELANDSAWENQSIAVYTLEKLGPAAHVAVPRLIELLKSPITLVRETAATALGAIGPKAAASADGLAELLGDESFTVSQNAAAALGAIGRSTDNVISRLADQIISRSNISGMAQEALVKLGTSTLPELIKRLGHADSEMRRAAAITLGRFPEMSPEVEGALLQRLKLESCPGTLTSVMRALVARAPQRIPEMVKALTHELERFPSELQENIVALYHGKPGAEDAFTEAQRLQLRSVLSNFKSAEAYPNPLAHLLFEVRQRDAWWFTSFALEISAGGGAGVPVLVEALESADTSKAFNIVTMLGRFDTYGSPAIPALTKLLDSPCPFLRAEATDALQSIARGSDETKAALAAEDSENDEIRTVKRVLALLREVVGGAND
jgi:HEAT repeat protein